MDSGSVSTTCDALHDLVRFVQFKKREKQCFSCFLNCANGTKLREASHIYNVDVHYR